MEILYYLRNSLRTLHISHLTVVHLDPPAKEFKTRIQQCSLPNAILQPSSFKLLLQLMPQLRQLDIKDSKLILLLQTHFEHLHQLLGARDVKKLEFSQGLKLRQPLELRTVSHQEPCQGRHGSEVVGRVFEVKDR